MMNMNNIGALAVIGIPVIASVLILLQGFAFNGDRKKIVMLSLIFGLLELGAVSYISYLTITSQFSS
ncbi:MAG: hypothetical protein QXO53_04650, partial [Fervidicoccaceae archaeon]